jgi:hypothetical protein
LHSLPTKAIHVMTADSAEYRRTMMTTFTIDEQNQIVAFATPEQAAAVTATPFDTFTSHQDLAELAAPWPAERLLAIWNTLPGVNSRQEMQEHQSTDRA